VTRKAKNAQNDRGGRSARATERRVAHAVIHPIRLDALSILFERMASPKEIALLLRKPLGTVSFHVAELLADEAIELVKTEPRRGAVEHYYRARLRPEVSDEEWRALPKGSRRKFAATLLQAIVAEGLASLRYGKMDADEDLHLAWLPMRLDAEGRDEVSELQAEMLGRLEAVKERSEARLPADGDDAASVRIVVTMGFERGRPNGQPPGDSLSLN
jgi:hypothetical protein